MSIDGAFRLTFRNFSTVFLLVCSVTVPLHLAYGVAFRNVIAVSDLHSAIERFPKDRHVHGVGLEQLEQSRLAFGVLTALEIISIPYLMRASARVLDVDENGGVPTATDALRHIADRQGPRLRPLLSHGLSYLLTAVVFALAIGYLSQRIGLIVIEPLHGELLFAADASVRALARALGAPFLLVPAAVAGRPEGLAEATEERPPKRV